MSTLHSSDAFPAHAASNEEICVFPASFAEERLLFLDRLEPGSALYNIFACYIVEGELDHAALMASVNEIVRRHEILRTTFAISQGRSVQVVETAATVPIPVMDLESVPEPERLEKAQRLALEETLRPFDLEHGPLLRIRLFRTGDRSHLLVLTVHHIVFDAWSMDIFRRELAILYPAFHAGSSPQLPELPIQYGDFAEWQRQWLTGEVLEKQLSYWQQQLAGAPGLLELPTDRPRPPVQSSRGERHVMALSKLVSRQLRALSRREGATLFITLLAAFQTFLGRLTEKEDILVGTPIAGRNRRETEELIGLFVNTLVLRGDLSGDPTFRQLLGRVRDTALEAHAHQDLPFEKLVEELRPARNLGHTPLFQVMFGLQNASRETWQIPGLTLCRMAIHRPLTHFDLSLDVVEREEELDCVFWFNTDLFDSSTIIRLAGHFRRLLEAIVADPDQSIWELPLSTEAERQQLLIDSNDTDVAIPPQGSVHQLFEEQAARSPKAVAAIHGVERLTYRELDTSANRLAHYLRRLQVGPEVRVAICMERSLEMLVGLLGILKAGGAYVPVDPTYPRERLEFLLQDSGAAVVLTQEKLAGLLPEGGHRVVRLDADQGVICRESGEAPPRSTGPEDLAYIIYTSGSTGRPKGVEILHGGLLNYVTAVSRLYETTPSDRVLQFSSLSFDSAADEIFIPLATGATVVLRSDEMLRSVPAFLDACREMGVTILIFPTAYWHELVAGMATNALRFPQSVRLACFGGEKALPERLLQWRQVAGDRVRLWNGYGPTEATIAATFCDLTEWLAGTPSPATVPIGKPIANVKAYVLDRRGELRPPGLSGELYIGGAGLGRGYRNLPEQTARRFVASPLREGRGERLYRTGDLVRHRHDGNLEFLGRLDDQVKIRGFRIELGEIETILGRHPQVQEAVVLAREDAGGDRRLIAYVVAVSDGEAAPSELRQFLKGKLPEYMLPAEFVTLKALPMTPTGKVDRRALPAPGEKRPESESGFLAPRDDLEIRIARVWEKVLGVEPIGVRDNFFDIGGHSLLAVRLFSQIEKVTGKQLPLATLFQAPTVEELTRILRQEGWTAPWSPLVAIQPRGSKPPFFCVHPGGGHVLYYRDLARRLGPDQPFYGLQVKSLSEKKAYLGRLENLAADYVKEIRTVQSEGPYYLGGLCAGGVIAFEMAQQLHAQGQDVALLALLDTYAPGHPKLLPNTKSFGYKVYRFFRRVHLEASNLLLLGRREKLTYVLTKAKRVQGRNRQRIRRMVKKLHAAIRHPLPRELRQVQEHNRQLLNVYVPQVYSGPATVFRATNQPVGYESDPLLGWGELVAGGIETYEVPGHHESIAVEPRVRILAEQLRQCLEKSRSAEKERSSPVEVAGVGS